MNNEEIVKEIQAGYNEKENMEKLWNNMEKLIRLIAKRYDGYGNMEDLQQEGFIALYNAIKHYDNTQDVPFATYATYWIKQRLNRYIIKNEKLVVLPEYLEQRRRKYKRAITDYEKEHGKKPTRIEICKILLIDMETLIEIEKNENIAQIGSLNTQIKTQDIISVEIMDIVPGKEDENTIIEQIDNNMLLESVYKVIAELPKLERKIIMYKHIQELKNDEIASMLNVSQEDISKIYSKAMRHLRKLVRRENIYSEWMIARCYARVGLNTYNTTWNSVTERVALKL